MTDKEKAFKVGALLCEYLALIKVNNCDTWKEPCFKWGSYSYTSPYAGYKLAEGPKDKWFLTEDLKLSFIHGVCSKSCNIKITDLSYITGSQLHVEFPNNKSTRDTFMKFVDSLCIKHNFLYTMVSSNTVNTCPMSYGVTINSNSKTIKYLVGLK